MRRRRLSSAVAVAGLALGTVFAGVAGAGDSPDTDFSKLKPIKEPANCKDGDGITADTIKVGVITPTSGPQAQSYAPSTEQGIDARIEEANSSGELGDRTIEIVKKDDQGSQANNLTAAQQLVEEEGVFGIIELSPAADGSAEYLYDENIPVGGWHNGLKEWGIYPNMFSWRNTVPPEPENTFTSRAGDVMKELGAKKIAIVGTNLAASAVFVDQTKQAIDKTKGLEVVYDTTDVTPEQQDFTGIADAIRTSGADGVYTGLAGLQANSLSQALKQAGVDLTAIVFPGGYDDRVTGLPGYEGAYLGTEFKPLEVGAPGLTKYTDAMEAAGFEPLRFFAIQGYFAADAYINGIKAAGVGCPTRKAFINNLRLEKGYDADGAFVPVDYAEIFGRPFYCVYYLQIQDQQFVPVNDGEPICATKLFEDGKTKKLSEADQAKG
jgi:branched-chain amino acid transport system substrate-binding protein